MDSEDRLHHQDRALQEFDLAYRAKCPAAARAHLGLALLHMRSMERAAATADPSTEAAPQFETGIGSPALVAATLYAGTR